MVHLLIFHHTWHTPRSASQEYWSLPKLIDFNGARRTQLHSVTSTSPLTEDIKKDDRDIYRPNSWTMKSKNLKQKTKMNWRYQKSLSLFHQTIFFYFYFLMSILHFKLKTAHIIMSSLGWLLDLRRMFRADVRSLTCMWEIEFIKICYNVLNIWCVTAYVPIWLHCLLDVTLLNGKHAEEPIWNLQKNP